MDNKKSDSSYQPDLTNYDYVWGSDQDEYEKNKVTSNEDVSDEMKEEPRAF